MDMLNYAHAVHPAKLHRRKFMRRIKTQRYLEAKIQRLSRFKAPTKKEFGTIARTQKSDVTKRNPKMPFLWTNNEDRWEYTQWKSHNPVLFDDVDRICRLLKASKSAPSPTRTMGSKAW
ncbi:hypothetical protein BO79DRAFT_258544 [Aspergillus costaricaensis CBS 115574]|uniref:Uncharacterized protein n=1 Tax=Aspergillus costaricaensis CBS 115574 TaxID=1448317 RepID=A0ACD1I4M0_9EURO|nr:hypothetical protein BO79DRAFT_258544 [Aspergillus costaricaensis CBS 115574]RAK85265.1 hypothetical protein BO79DRAFT_258544 [Aspergillus costaricaensis CBS 115574]